MLAMCSMPTAFALKARAVLMESGAQYFYRNTSSTTAPAAVVTVAIED